MSSMEDLLHVLRCGGHNAGRLMSVILWVKVKTFVCQLASVQPEKHVMVLYVGMQVKFGMPYFLEDVDRQRVSFSGLLEKSPAEANAFLSNPEEYKKAMRSAGDAQARELLERVVECLVTERCVTFEDCIRWARMRYIYLCISFELFCR